MGDISALGGGATDLGRPVEQHAGGRRREQQRGGAGLEVEPDRGTRRGGRQACGRRADQPGAVGVGQVAEQSDASATRPSSGGRQQREAAARRHTFTARRRPARRAAPARRNGASPPVTLVAICVRLVVCTCRSGVNSATTSSTAPPRPSARTVLRWVVNRRSHRVSGSSADRRRGPRGFESSAIFRLRLGSGRAHLCSHPGAEHPCDGDTDFIDTARGRHPRRESGPLGPFS